MSASDVTVVAFLLAMPAIVTAQSSDTTPPSLATFHFEPSDVDLTAGPHSIDVVAEVRDALSGAGYLCVDFVSPSREQRHGSCLGRTDEGPHIARFAGEIVFPEHVEHGNWSATVKMADQTGNYVSMDRTNLSMLGFPSALEIDSDPDTTPPSIDDASFHPSRVDVTNADGAIVLRARLTDDLSGIDPSALGAYISGPGADRHFSIPGSELRLVSGNDIDQVRELSWTIPQHSAEGLLTLSIGVADRAGNTVYTEAASAQVVSSTPDRSPPVLSGFSFSPVVIDTSQGPAYVKVRMSLTDDLSGVDYSLESRNGGYFHGAMFSSPSETQIRSACCFEFDLTSGTVRDGTWEANVYFPQFSEAGTWRAKPTQVSDRAHNWFDMTPEQLADAGFAAELVVVRPSLVGDGAFDSTGGTIVDETFRDRARVTFPPGLVDENTVVAVDVFQDPLEVPVPPGYQAARSFFVSVGLTPEPASPYPYPGVTLVLPLPDFMNPGTGIPLFSVDRVTGTLEPVARVDTAAAGSVVGVVGSDGLSATFDGVSHLGIVVALVPDTIEASIDVDPYNRPGGPNRIDPDSISSVDVTVLGDAVLDVLQVDESTVRFGARGAVPWRCKDRDSNSDGVLDKTCSFSIPDTAIACGDTSATLTGRTFGGQSIIGADTLVTTGCSFDTADTDTGDC